MKKRIWELDAFRGICILGMIAVHFVYDLVYLYRLVDWTYPTWFSVVQSYGGILFIVLSGICVTLGHHHVKRGAIVFGCGLLISLVTYGMYRLGFLSKGTIIYFGVLHCLGLCMLLWALLRKLPSPVLLCAGVLLAAAGLYLNLKEIYPVDVPYWMFLGLRNVGLSAGGDYFPLMPNLGYFLIGAVIGRYAYAKKESLTPKVNERNPIIRFFSFCGRQSLWIYMGHQPILAGICMLISYLK